MTITTDIISALRDDLTALPSKPNRRLSARDAVTALAAELTAARASGYSLGDLATQLTDRGVPISASTLGSYLRAIDSEPDGPLPFLDTADDDEDSDRPWHDRARFRGAS